MFKGMPEKIALARIEYAYETHATTLDLSSIVSEQSLSETTIYYSKPGKLNSVPKEIGQLTDLIHLNLSNNRLTVLPAEIASLTNLISLNLASNQLTALPTEVSYLTRLRTLNLYNNHLSNLPIDMSKLLNLRRLDISFNELEALPEYIGTLKRLIDLELVNNRVSFLPASIKGLTNLQSLAVSRNNIMELPPEIGELSQLTSLDASHNQLVGLPVEIKKLSNLLELKLANNRLATLPAEIGKLTGIRELNLDQNNLKFLPDEFSNLVKLENLAISNNQLEDLPSDFGRFKGLRYLSARNNRFRMLPSHIGSIETLNALDLKNNHLLVLPESIKKLSKLKQLDLSGNLLLGIPPEIIEKWTSPNEILAAYSSQRQPLYEVKILLVGQGSVGKTSLLQRIVFNTFDQSQPKTDGISINAWKIAEGDTPKSHWREMENGRLDIPTDHTPSLRDQDFSLIKLNIWDFGGQEIMHATHQFFLTKRSLYILVLDSRLTQEENRVEYWLKITQSFGAGSPVLIVGNKIDQHPLDIDRTGLQRKYPNILGILEVSAATGAGIEALKDTIAEQVNNLPHVRDLLPETWFKVKTKLESLGRKTNFITHDKYIELCIANEVYDETSQRTLIGFMHDLGIVLHFQDDPRLESLGILNPQWVTNGVYKIINSHVLFQNKGVLTVSMLDEILNLPEYPRGKRLFIVDMMKKFELCYDIEPDKIFLVPDLLPKDEPVEMKINGIPAFEYAYPVLPSSVITRFIVRMNQHIHDGFVWRTGVLFKIGENKALVKADIEDRKITIAIDGLEHTRRDTLSAIRYHLDEIHNSIKGLDAQKRVPVPNAPLAEPLKYEYLLKLERAGQETLLVENGNDLVTVSIRQMLSAIESEAQRRENAPGSVTTNYYISGDVNASGDFIGRDKNISAGDRSVIVGGDMSGNLISGNYNKINSAEIDPELKQTLQQLVEAVETMNTSLSEEQSAEVTEDLGKLVDEATKSKPNKKWYSVSIEGLIKAAENVEKVGEPVINLSRKVLSLLTGG